MPIHKGLNGAKFIFSLVLIILFAYVMVYADRFYQEEITLSVNPIFTESIQSEIASIDINSIVVASQE